MRFVALAVGPTIVLALTASQTVPTTASQAPGGDTAAAHRAVLNRYCVSCHNERNKANAGRLALDSVDLSRVGEHAEVLEKVILKLRAGLMPPPGRSRPEPAAHAALVGFLKTRSPAGGLYPVPACRRRRRHVGRLSPGSGRVAARTDARARVDARGHGGQEQIFLRRDGQVTAPAQGGTLVAIMLSIGRRWRAGQEESQVVGSQAVAHARRRAVRKCRTPGSQSRCGITRRRRS
jgi:hypothetical protein